MPTMNNARRHFLRQAATLSIAGAAAPFALSLASIGAAASAAASDYRALVCVFLYGANDHNNTVIPYDSENYAAYSNARSTLARPIADLLPLSPSAPLTGLNTGRQFALPKELAPLLPFWSSGQLAILANVGPLVVPTTKTQFLNASVPLPSKLFSHNDQQAAWQASAPDGARYGWGGRLGDLFAAQNTNSTFTCTSLAGSALYLAGQTLAGYQLDSSGAVAIAGLSNSTLFGSNSASATLKTLLTQSNGSQVFIDDLVNTTKRSISANDDLTTALRNVPEFTLSTELSDNPLAAQLRMVSRTIAARETLGAKRQLFFVALNGFDTHDNQLSVQPALHTQLADALAYFYHNLESLGVATQVTSFTASDFGRTLVSNGDGSDHGWGGHHFILGGAVKGQQFYGSFPIMGLNNNDEVGSGRLLPSTAVDQYAATLAAWFGVSASDMPLVLPNLGHFSNTNLGFMTA